MKNPFRFFCLLAAAFTALLACILGCVPAHAQTAAADGSAITTAALDTAATVAEPFIVTLAQKYPWLISALAVIATLRLVFKPIMGAVHAYVQSTASTSDDETLAKVETSRTFKVIAWLLDYLGSIKVGPQKPQAKQETPAS